MFCIQDIFVIILISAYEIMTSQAAFEVGEMAAVFFSLYIVSISL